MLQRSLSVGGSSWLTTRDDVVGAIVTRVKRHTGRQVDFCFSTEGGACFLEDQVFVVAKRNMREIQSCAGLHALIRLLLLNAARS